MKADPDALAVIATFLQEAEADDDIIGKASTHGNVAIGQYRVSVKGWVEARYKGANWLRFRVLDTPATSYRIVFGYDWHTRRIGILAVVHKDEFDYGISGQLADRIYDDWDCATGGRRT